MRRLDAHPVQRIPFNGSPNPTVGVEVELQIIDPETKNLVSGASRILERVKDTDHIKPQLIASTIELNTDVCANIETVRSELSDRFRSLLELCDELGYELACVGTHPFSRWAEQDITPKQRYHLLVDRCQGPARRLRIFGLHVHVGIESGEKAIAIFNSLSTYIPHLLALSASSPYFQGEETGLASCRVKIFESLPTAGLPYRLLNWAEFQRLMITLVNARAIESVREIWWDVRSHPEFGTVEGLAAGLRSSLTTWVQIIVVSTFAQPNSLLSSHFLFLYSSQLGAAFHESALRERCRVATEVRVFPPLALGGRPSPFVDHCADDLRRAGFDVTINHVPYEFRRGGNQMMRVRAPQTDG